MLRMIRAVVLGALRNGVAAIALVCLWLMWSLPVVEAVNGGMPASAVMSEARLQPATADMEPPAALMAQSESTPTRTPAGNGGFRYAIGDRLKITFYEQLAGEGDKAARGRVRSLIERPELSSEYVVQLGGDVFLPIIGAVPVARKTPAEAEAVLFERARAATGERLKVSVVIAEREPVYVMGALPRTGVYKYTPGMVVAQVVALAGGNSGTGGDSWQQIDMAREHERMRKAVERMKRQLATIDVLMAEQRSALPQPSVRLTEIAGAHADAFIMAAREARELERERLHQHVASIEKLVAATKSDLESSRSRMDQVAGVVRDRTKRRDDLAARFTRGVSTENLIVQARNELVEVQSSWHEVRSAVARTEIRILELERDRDQTILAARIDREQQLRTARQAVADEEIMLSSIGPLLIRSGPANAGRKGSGDVTYALIRRTPEGPMQMEAEAMTPLEPGDVVQVVKNRQDIAAVQAQ